MKQFLFIAISMLMTQSIWANDERIKCDTNSYFYKNTIATTEWNSANLYMLTNTAITEATEVLYGGFGFGQENYSLPLMRINQNSVNETRRRIALIACIVDVFSTHVENYANMLAEEIFDASYYRNYFIHVVDEKIAIFESLDLSSADDAEFRNENRRLLRDPGLSENIAQIFWYYYKHRELMGDLKQWALYQGEFDSRINPHDFIRKGCSYQFFRETRPAGVDLAHIRYIGIASKPLELDQVYVTKRTDAVVDFGGIDRAKQLQWIKNIHERRSEAFISLFNIVNETNGDQICHSDNFKAAIHFRENIQCIKYLVHYKGLEMSVVRMLNYPGNSRRLRHAAAKRLMWGRFISHTYKPNPDKKYYTKNCRDHAFIKDGKGFPYQVTRDPKNVFIQVVYEQIPMHEDVSSLYL